MSKENLGTKRVCSGCQTRFYDLNRTPVFCPKCQSIFEEGSGVSSRFRNVDRRKPVQPETEHVADVEASDDDDTDVEFSGNETLISDDESDTSDVPLMFSDDSDDKEQG